jgi:NAD(P)-dependent dehydrogenase (short-subunit alcohol dehydrogenase family)
MRHLIVRIITISLFVSLSSPVLSAADEAAVQKAVLITGATSGIGRNIAERLAKAGYFVYAGARKEADIAELDRIENIMAVRLDVTKQGEIDAAVKLIEKQGRGLWGIVNNAGINIKAPMIEAEESDLHFLFDVNIYGVFRVTKAFAPLVIESKGRIVNISSISGVLSGFGFGMYSMSKHAIESYSDTLSRELEDLGVFVSAIEPGNYRSEIGISRCKRLLADADSKPYRYFEDWRQELLKDCQEWLDEGAPNNSPEPDAVAAAVQHALFSDEPRYNYLVVPEQRQAGWTILKAMEELLMLNGGHAHSYSQEELVDLMKMMWPYSTGEKSFENDQHRKQFGAFIEPWIMKGKAEEEN